MGSPLVSVESALNGHLLDYTAVDNIPVAWPNVGLFVPTNGVAYLRPSFLPGATVQAEMGEHGRNLHVGIYQIDVFYPAKTGTLGAGTMRDEIIDHFKRGTVIDADGEALTITRAFSGPMQVNPDWVQIPITVQYRIFAAN